ncbi:MAG: hypothetical protein RBS78_08650, partial [Coriobacteriia bacterium]|nr:hypothetical protein [Coriobacteriia bacterium]
VAIAAGDLACGSCHPRGHYAGASLNRYLTWSEALDIMARIGVDPALQDTPHGGYAVNTTKCAVCHSVHRADTDLAVAGVGSYWKLTPGAQACVACHTPSGSNPVSTSLVEWPSTYDEGGPHNSFGCLGGCHGSVHGAVQSEYGAISAWNLTARNDAAIAAAFAAGNVASPLGNANSASVASGGGSHPDDYYANFGDAEFRANAIGENDAYGGNQQKAVMRAMATGYTCGASGCHSSSQFAVNAAGYAEMRASDPRANTTLDVAMTGHATNSIRGCEPCHASRDSKCAGCHDMVGKATNSSAFPHANRKITVFETDAAGTKVDKAVDGGNLWMLSGDATLRDADGVPSASGTANPERRVVEDSTSWHGTPGNINDGTCIKCHGLRYFGPSYFSHSSTADFTRK